MFRSFPWNVKKCGKNSKVWFVECMMKILGEPGRYFRLYFFIISINLIFDWPKIINFSIIPNVVEIHRLIRGDGEILEEIVSETRHKEINRTATKGDGASFQANLNAKMKCKQCANTVQHNICDIWWKKFNIPIHLIFILIIFSLFLVQCKILR